ncbi:MAG: adenylate/guanylate cyclase domain-containing protein [Actinomycetota bacterium]
MQICPNCGEENPDRFRLCGFCGTSLAPEVPAEEVRRTVSIVFSDLKGSTALGERLDSEHLREVLNLYFNEMRLVLERHGGRVEKYIGDAIMAVFGLPRLHEDDAVRAVRAAFEMKERLVDVNEMLHERFGVRLENRTGVNTGEVVAGDVSSGQRLVTGDTVNTAARLEQNAPAMEILIGESTYALVRDAVTVEQVEPLPLKGKAQLVPAYLLLGVSGQDDGYSRRLDLPIVGREHELGVLQEAFGSAVAEQRCHIVTVFGPAGVGKSRLLKEFLERIGSDASTLKGRCLSYGEGVTYWPIGEVVRAAAGIGADDGLEAARVKLAAMLPGHEDVTQRVGAAIGLIEESFSAEETFWAIRRALEISASRRPLVVLVDDIHWAERTLLDLLRFVVDECRAPVLLLCSSRRELLEEYPEWGGDSGRFSTLTVEPLAADESARVMQNLLGVADLDPTMVERVTVAADGNPLYLEQMLQMLIDQGAIRHEGGQWVTTEALSQLDVPPTIAALLTARLDRLGHSERTVIERSAVIGQVFYRGAVEALVPPPVRSEVAHSLKTLTVKELIAPHEELLIGEVTFRFLHALIRDAAYGGLLKRTRAELHVAFVDWVESAAGDRILEYEEIRGYHLEQAYQIRSGLGVADADVETLGRRAASYLGAAGRRALARGDLPAADNLLRRAAATLPHGDALAVELLVEAGEALVDLGELVQADEVLGSAIDQAMASGDTIAALGARIVRMRLHYETEGEDPDGTLLQDVEGAVKEFEQAEDHMGLIRASHLLLLMHWTAGQYGAAEQAALRTIEHARAVGDRTREIRILPALATCSTYGPTPVEEAAARCHQLLEEVGGDQKADALIRASLARLEAMRGNFDEARQLYRRSRATLEEFGWNLFAALTSIDSGSVELLAKDPVGAESELRRDFETLDAMGERNYIATTAAYLAFALLLQGRYEEADGFVKFSEETAAPDDLTSQFLWRQFRSRLLSIEGKHEDAIAMAQRAVALTDQTEETESQGNSRLDLAHVYARAGKTAEAATAFREAQERFELKGIVVLVDDVRQRLEALSP